MEFPDLGKKCTAASCNVHDFLPFSCIYCKHIFCQSHFKLQDHQCPSLNDPMMDVRVPVCPLCEKPVTVPRGQDPNIRMNEHIQNNCADLQPKNDNTCPKKGCITKMLVPMQCPDCGRSFCVKHRLPIDHACKGKQVETNSSNNSRAEMERQRKERINKRKQEISRLQQKLKQGMTEQEQVQLAKLQSASEEKSGKCVVS